MVLATQARFPLHVESTTPPRSTSTAIRDLAATPSRPLAFSTSSYSAAPPNPLLRIAIGGEYAAVKSRQVKDNVPREWRRGTVQTFSARSRSRMLQSLAKTDRRAVSDDGLFVTLTYPREWPPTTRACKNHLESFRKRINRLYPRAWFYWKLEYQKRGAEHFHLLMFNMPTVNPEWFKDTWHDIVKLGNHWHTEYGADVKKMDNWKQAGAYCSKYAAKVDESTSNDGSGRYWGIATRKNRVENVVEVEISDGEMFAIRRIFKRLIGVKRGYHAPGGPTSGVWIRVGNEVAKRVAGWAAAEYHPYRGRLITLPTSDDDETYRQPSYSEPNSTDGSDVDWKTTTDHNPGKPTLALFDSADQHRRSAQRRA